MKLPCVIIEDQPPAQRILQKYIRDLEHLQLVGVFSDGLEAMHFMQNNRVYLVFLDIHLPKLSGIDLLKTLNPRPHTILTTAFSDYALESYEYNVVDYLLKPFSFERFVKAVAKVPSPENEERAAGQTTLGREEVYVKSGYEHIRVRTDRILYIQSDADYTEIVTGEKKYLSNEPLRFWTENLNAKTFLRVHKSYIVNTSKIEKLLGNRVYLTNGSQLPIGRAFKESFMKSLMG